MKIEAVIPSVSMEVERIFSAHNLVKCARRTMMNQEVSSAQTRLLSMKAALLPFGGKKLEEYVEKVVSAMIDQKMWPRFKPNMERVQAHAAKEVELRREMRTQLTQQLTQQISEQLSASLTPTIAETVRASVVASVCKTLAHNVASELCNVNMGMTQLHTDLQNMLTDETAQSIRKFVSPHSKHKHRTLEHCLPIPLLGTTTIAKPIGAVYCVLGWGWRTASQRSRHCADSILRTATLSL